MHVLKCAWLNTMNSAQPVILGTLGQMTELPEQATNSKLWQRIACSRVQKKASREVYDFAKINSEGVTQKARLAC